MDHRRPLLPLCLAVPALVLAASYAWLALDHGRAWLWPVVVHESGRYTLAQTVLYTSHFLREVPTVLAYALFLLAAGAGAVRERTSTAAAHRRAAIAAAAALALIVLAFVDAAAQHGSRSALLDLLQHRTRDDLAGYGSHWRYHWLSTLWFGAATLLLPSLLARFGGRLHPHAGFATAAWLYFAALTLVFGISADVFLEVRHAGHQAREILTHAPVTLLLGTALLLRAAPAHGTARSPVPVARHRVAALLAIAIPVHLAVVALTGDVMDAGQTELGLAAMVAAHFFEHTLDYLLLVLLVSAGVEWVAARARAHYLGHSRTALPFSCQGQEQPPFNTTQR